jgi:hypothetical protein
VIFAFVLWGLIVNLTAWSLTLTANVLVPCQVIYARCPHINDYETIYSALFLALKAGEMQRGGGSF